MSALVVIEKKPVLRSLISQRLHRPPITSLAARGCHTIDSCERMSIGVSLLLLNSFQAVFVRPFKLLREKVIFLAAKKIRGGFIGLRIGEGAFISRLLICEGCP
jgi:hypothetical protein